MQVDIHAHRILILDFGSQYTQLIARRVRELGVYCELRAYDMTADEIKAFNPKGIILSGGPESVTEANTPRAPEAVFSFGVPVLGICYGMQTMAQQLGGLVESSNVREFGYAEVNIAQADSLFNGIEDRAGFIDVWMSHGDKVTRLPEGFNITASTPSCPIAAMSCEAKRFYGMQFHPEVTHTLQGEALLRRFVREICACDDLWTPAQIIEDSIRRIREQVGDDPKAKIKNEKCTWKQKPIVNTWTKVNQKLFFCIF